MSKHLLIPLFWALLCVNCNSSSNNIKDDNIRPVKSVVAKSSKYIIREFVGLSTPEQAVNLAFKISGGTYVWVIDDENRVIKRPITISEPTQKSSVVVSSGINSYRQRITIPKRL